MLRDQGVHLTIEGAALLVASLVELLEVPKIGYHPRDIPHFVMDICFASCRRSLENKTIHELVLRPDLTKCQFSSSMYLPGYIGGLCTG